MPRLRPFRRPRRLPRPAARAGFALGVLLVLASAATAVAQEAVCAECHDDVQVPEAPHGELGCTACHANIEDYPHPEGALQELGGAAICAQCHDAADTLAASIHAPLGCTECHGDAHAIRPTNDLDSAVSPANQIQTCATCHGEPAELIDGYLQSVHARALLSSGLIAAPTCNDCHGAHDVLPPEDPASRVAAAHVPETCGSCHALILRDWEGASAHGEAWKQGYDGAPVCITCHTSHAIEEPRLAVMRGKVPENCGNCHDQKYSSYRDSFHGQATDLGFVTAAVCSDCHTPHQNLPASDPRSSIHPDNLQATCGSCHGAVSAAFVTFDPHSEPQSAERNAVVHWVWVAMTALLIAVFAFFGVHDALWLQRVAVGLSRGEFHREPRRGDVWVRRFGRGQIAVHATVIVTFLLLALTGLPLRFHFTDWAQGLAAALGGVGMTSLLHRLAAIATFGYFLVHVGTLAQRGVVRKEPGLLWGWKSMVPRGKDLTDMWQNLRWFLYLGKRPRLDRFAYWEKFDYFAVFWGVVIIGGSGLVLWFPGFFTRFLPGWTLNAAHVVHSDEALLAVGFIFVFHFFHTHLRPEVFPLDPVIFTGTMPLERFQQERPLEYERLRRRGELESRLTGPPTPAALRRARILGALAVLTGLLLVVGILVGFFGS